MAVWLINIHVITQHSSTRTIISTVMVKNKTRPKLVLIENLHRTAVKVLTMQLIELI